MIKKRILALLLAVITITQICITALPVIAEDTDVTIDPSIIGATVRFNTANTVYMYNSVTESNISTKAERVLPSSLPETLKVLDAVINVAYNGDRVLFYKLGTVDGSENTILEKYSWAKAVFFEIVPQPEPDEDELVTGEVELSINGENANSLTIKRDEKIYVHTEL